MVKTAEFWDKSAEKYSKSPIRDEEAYNKKLEATRRYFQQDSRVLEFGCGTGTTALNHAPYVGHIIATDISPKMIEIAQAKAADANIENVEFRCETLKACIETEGSFDVVMAHNILHLLEDPQTAINISYGLLKPGGVFVSSTACLGDGLPLWRIFIFFAKLIGKAPFVNVMKRKTLEGYLRNAGFEVDLQWNKSIGAFIILRKPQTAGEMQSST